jgi:Spy/CpxP family protein refolding chaperone
MTKFRELMEQARQNMDAAAREKLRELTQARTALQKEYQGKVTALLTEEQKKVYEDSLRFRTDVFRGPGTTGQFLPPAVQERLNLTPEQREQINKLQKELEEKIMNILTEEQKKQLEQLRSQRTGVRRPGGNPPPR